MDVSEALTALGMCVAYDNRTVSRMNGEAWAAALPDIRLEDAKAAIVEHYSRTRDWIMPADVRNAVTTIRRKRVQDMRTPQPPESISADDTATERAWTRAYTAAIGDGHDEATADRVACATVGVTRPQIEATPRPVPELVAQVAAAMPRIPRKAAS